MLVVWAREWRAAPFPVQPGLAPVSCSVPGPRRQQTPDHPSGSEQQPALARRQRGAPEASARRWLHAGVLLLPTAVLPRSSPRQALLHLPGRPSLLPTPPGRRRASPCHLSHWIAAGMPHRRHAPWRSRPGSGSTQPDRRFPKRCPTSVIAPCGDARPPPGEIAPCPPLPS